MSNFGLTPYRKSSNLRPYTLANTFFDDDIFKSFFGNSFGVSQMSIDVKDEKDKYVIEAELPGINKEDINIDIEGGVLTLSTHCDSEKNEENENYVYRERRYGSVSRSFALDNIDDENIKAKYENGILMIDLPKRELEKKLNKSIDIL